MAYLMLVVDDDEEDYMILNSHVKRCNHEVETIHCSDGQEAIEYIQNNPPLKLIVLDNRMPGMDGHELLRWIRQTQGWQQIPVVVWAGELMDDEISDYYAAGANSIIDKNEAILHMDAFCTYWFTICKLPMSK